MSAPISTETSGVDESNEFVALLHGAMRAVRRESGTQLSPLGTTPGQFRMLRFLSHSDQPVRLGMIADHLDIAPRSVTSKVDDAEADGFVRRIPDRTDRRAILVELTPDGRRLVAQVSAQRASSASGLLARLDGAERAELLRLLRVITLDPR